MKSFSKAYIMHGNHPFFVVYFSEVDNHSIQLSRFGSLGVPPTSCETNCSIACKPSNHFYRRPSLDTSIFKGSFSSSARYSWEKRILWEVRGYAIYESLQCVLFKYSRSISFRYIECLIFDEVSKYYDASGLFLFNIVLCQGR